MKFLSLLSVTLSLLQFVFGKGAKKDSNVIAVFSEDELTGKLPNPESIAAEIPKNLILQKQKKLRAADLSVQSEDKVMGKREMNKNDEKLIVTEAKDKKKKNKMKKRDNLDEVGNFDDRKSKSMTDREEDTDDDDEKNDTFIVVESTPFDSQPSTQISIPTATAVKIISTEPLKDLIQIAKIDATTTPQLIESPTIPPQKRRQFTPRNRMDVKRSNSSSNHVNLCNYRIIIYMVLSALIIMGI